MPKLDGSMPESLRRISSTLVLEPGVPALLVHPEEPLGEGPVPFLLWLHGRTACKELDPGRYLRLARAGIGSCALDLPGHGERHDERSQHPRMALSIIEQAASELDDVMRDLGRRGAFDLTRAAIGGMSMGGMIAMVRLTRANPFRAAIFEATSGSWHHQLDRQFADEAAIEALDPIRHLDAWREIPIMAVHSRDDAWVHFKGQEEFIDALRARYRNPEAVETMFLEKTGAPHEHLGFGSHANQVRLREIAFLRTHLLDAST